VNGDEFRLGEDDAWAILTDPSASSEQVRDIAHAYPDMRAAAANHPAAYPALLDWLDQTGDPAVAATVARRRDHDARTKQPPRAIGASATSDRARRVSGRRSRRPTAAGWAVLGFLVPVVGLILWIVWADSAPRKARKARNGLVGSLVFSLLIVAGLITGVLIQSPPQEAAAIPPPPPAPSVPVMQVDPPDGDAQHAWITVPSAHRVAGALVVDVHTDYQCPTCQIMEKVYGPMLQKLSDSGAIIWRQHSRIAYDQVLGNDLSLRASMAAACMDVADAAKYAAFHLMIFAGQPNFTDTELRDTWPAAVGLTASSLAVYQNCYDNQQTLGFIEDGELSNLQATLNQSPPNVYTFGGNKPNSDASGACTGAIGGTIGVCHVPDFYVQGVEFSLSDLFKADFTPKYKSTNALLTMLKRIAAKR